MRMKFSSLYFNRTILGLVVRGKALVYSRVWMASDVSDHGLQPRT